MHIIIMRHGEAAYKGADRILTANGHQEAQATGIKLAALFTLHKIYVSPKTRAQETAEAVKSQLRGRPLTPEILPELCPSGSAELVRDYVLASAKEHENILIVSHIPLVESLTYEFCPLSSCPMFGTACALAIRIENGTGHLERMITPSTEIVF